MKTFAVGEVVYRLVADQRAGQWFARAEHPDTRNRFGVECCGTTERDAIDRLERWLEWQSEHTAALEALRQAERAYQRTVAGGALASAAEGAPAIEMQKESLEQVEAARIRLDEVRARKPE